MAHLAKVDRAIRKWGEITIAGILAFVLLASWIGRAQTPTVLENSWRITDIQKQLQSSADVEKAVTVELLDHDRRLYKAEMRAETAANELDMIFSWVRTGVFGILGMLGLTAYRAFMPHPSRPSLVTEK